MKVVSRQVREFRLKRGLSQAELAAKIGTKQGAISRVESPEYSRMTLTTLRKIADALDLDLLVELSEKPPKQGGARWPRAETSS